MSYRVVVSPGARRESFREVVPGSFAIAVKEEAKGNAANQRVRELLARHFAVSEKRVRIVTGQRGKNKRVEIV